MIKEKLVDIVGGSGGPYNNAVPVYGDNKAPNGAQVYGPNGKQLMLENSATSGVHYVVVDPQLVTQEENKNSRFLTFKPDGKVNYARTWILNEGTGHGEDYAPGVEMWMEFSHLAPYNPTTEPEPDKLHNLVIVQIGEKDWTITEVE